MSFYDSVQPESVRAPAGPRSGVGAMIERRNPDCGSDRYLCCMFWKESGEGESWNFNVRSAEYSEFEHRETGDGKQRGREQGYGAE